MNESFHVVERVLESGRAKAFIKGLVNLEVNLRQAGFFKGRGWVYGKGFQRPASMPTPYAWGPMILSVQKSKVMGSEADLYEIGLCTMGQFGVDYADIWLGRFRRGDVMCIVKSLEARLNNLPHDINYNGLDRLLRQEVRELGFA